MMRFFGRLVLYGFGVLAIAVPFTAAAAPGMLDLGNELIARHVVPRINLEGLGFLAVMITGLGIMSRAFRKEEE